MSNERISLQRPPLGFVVGTHLERLPPVRWVRRLRRPRQADVFLLSFPKTGRTWLRVMMASLLARHFDRPELEAGELGDRAPRIEGVPRVLAKHDGKPERKTASEIDPDRSEFAACRVILLVRDPRDAVVSNYFQVTRRERSFSGDLSTYLRWPRGSFDTMLRYYNVWAAERHVPRELMLVRYEDLHHDAARELRRVASFLGLQSVSDETVSRSVEHGRFGSMQRREAARPADGTPLAAGRQDDPESFKARRGKIGGFVDYLGPEDVAWMNRRIESELDPWYGYGAAPRPIHENSATGERA